LDLRYRGKTFHLQRDSTGWKYGNDSIATSVMASMLRVLSNLQADDFVDTLYQPKTKAFEIRVRTSGEADLRFFPQPPDSSKYFVQTSESAQGFTLNKWRVQELLKPIEKYQK